MTGGGNIAIYQLLQKAGDADWTDEERSKLLVLEKGLFSFNGRARVMSMIDRLVFFDEEIGVNNLKFFMKTVGSYIAAGRIGQYGVCYFNLKRFSVINQNLGRDGGTAVMRKFISLLGEKLLDGEYVCRIGGDNFIVLFQKEHLNVIKEHLNGIGIIYDEKNNERVFVSAYAGFYLISPDCRNPSEIMDNVSIAANTAKNDLKRGVYFSTKI